MVDRKIEIWAELNEVVHEAHGSKNQHTLKIGKWLTRIRNEQRNKCKKSVASLERFWALETCKNVLIYHKHGM